MMYMYDVHVCVYICVMYMYVYIYVHVRSTCTSVCVHVSEISADTYVGISCRDIKTKKACKQGRDSTNTGG